MPIQVAEWSAMRSIDIWNFGFESRRELIAAVVIFQAQSVWSLVQRGPTECGVSECDREATKGEAMNRRRVKEPQERKINF